MGRILTTIYSCNQKILKENETFNLNELQEHLLSRGINCKRSKSSLIVNLQDCKFQLYATGRIGLVFFKPPLTFQEFEENTLEFFKEKFGKECISKIKGG